MNKVQIVYNYAQDPKEKKAPNIQLNENPTQYKNKRMICYTTEQFFSKAFSERTSPHLE